MTRLKSLYGAFYMLTIQGQRLKQIKREGKMFVGHSRCPDTRLHSCGFSKLRLSQTDLPSMMRDSEVNKKVAKFGFVCVREPRFERQR